MMKPGHLDELRDWFDGYVADFYGDDEFINANVKLKEDHTRRTCQEIRYIANKLGLSNHQKDIAEVIALFHDIGRFEQFIRFRTYNDAMSIRHALLGAHILRQKRVLESLEGQQQEWIIKAVEYHAEKQLPKDLNGPFLMFAQLIRDADKLDIYNVVTQFYKQFKNNPHDSSLRLELPDHPECSPHVVEKMLCGESVDYAQLRTLNDLKLTQLGWVYDINFAATLERIKERRFLETLADLLPRTAETEMIKKKIFSHVDERLKPYRPGQIGGSGNNKTE
jgi:putative nucleotidyltransferase with HDIG domain